MRSPTSFPRRLRAIGLVLALAIGGSALTQAVAAQPAQAAQAQGAAQAAAHAATQAATLTTTAATPLKSKTTAPDPADFDPGLIISDYDFFNPDSMTEAGIQAFLEGQDCRPKDGSPCLADFSQTTVSQPAEGPGHCTNYVGARNETASRIIAKVAAACTISPRVLLVLLQKEQSLLTRPSASGYLRATGYGCPDTADCDTKYFGFFNQVYNAAWQFRQYTQEPDRTYKIGQVDVGFNPNAECGSSVVKIQNQATANLYNYTPYQPNRSALKSAASEGDGCSAWGNLNFWTFYTAWFGPSVTDPFPAFLGSCLNFAGGQPCLAPRLLPRV
ncbi:hypothetical protein [Leifsonia kafniensis]